MNIRNTKREAIISFINELEQDSFKSNKNIIHLTIHPSNSLLPRQLSFVIRSKVISALNKISSNRNEWLKSGFVIEYGSDITDMNKKEIKRLGTHCHILLYTSMNADYVEKIAKSVYPELSSVHASTISTFNNKNYWIKDLNKFGDITYWTNC